MRVHVPPPLDTTAEEAASPPARPGRARHGATGAVTLGLALVTLGVLGLLTAAGVDLDAGLVGPVLLVVIGGGVVVGGIRGEPDGGLLGLAVAVGVVVLVASLATAVLDVPLRGTVGDVTETPAEATELADGYGLLMGSLTVDLREVELPAGTTDVEVSVGMGEVEILLPDDVAVEVDAAVAAGSTEVLGRTVDGIGVDQDRRSDGYDDASRRLSVRVRVGLGEARV